MVGLEGSPLFRAPSGKPNDSFQQVLLPIRNSTRQKAERALDKKHLELVNWKCIIFHWENARLHVFLMTRQKMLQLGWEVLIHPLYAPDIVPSDFHWFRSWQNYLNGKIFNSLEDCKMHLEQFLLKKIKGFGKMELWNCLKDGRR